MITIYKASAGSGKTFQLAREYIRLLLSDPDPHAYRHILAVTFTNKATDEMKRRILQELSVLSETPSASPYYADFVPALFPDGASLQQAARRRLSALLHDYTAFAVSTIDRFFQQTLRAFSREIGQFASYQVELDKAGLVRESVERLLDSLTEADTGLLGWLTDSVMAFLRVGGRFNLEKGLEGMASSLLSDAHAAAVVRYGIDEAKVHDRTRLKEVRKGCDGIMRAFVRQARTRAQAVLAVLREAGVDPGETNRGFLKQLYRYAELRDWETVPYPSASFLDKAPDSAKWFAKSKDRFRQRLEGVLDGPLADFTALFGQPYREYRTAGMIAGQVYALGIAGELEKAFADLERDKNVLSIDDSNVLLRRIIDGSDAPFVYEKLGVRYEHFLLDEFQDTSTIQWENFRPLIANSEAGGFDNLVVGDVKQAIYRWRGSDWRLFGRTVQEDFPASRVRVLQGNYRSLREIVAFNNGFFRFAAEQLDRLYGTDPADAESISAIYADVEQAPMYGNAAPGSVQVVFTEDADVHLQEIVDGIGTVLASGGRLSDVAVLVRGNREASRIADMLVHAGFPVISDDAMYVKHAVTVRRLVSQLSLMDAPARTDGRETVDGYLARALAVEVPAGYHSLVDLAEALLRGIRWADPDLSDREVAYIQAFMDHLQDWTALNGNSLAAFLQDWELANPRLSPPEGGDAVRVMTIHKSKGLEFPYVVFPFAEDVTLYRATQAWCRPAVEGTALEGLADGIYNVPLFGEDNLFAEDFRRELRLQLVDNLNIFYVAMTRARYGLKVIARMPSNLLAADLDEGRLPVWKDMSQVLYAYTHRHPALYRQGLEEEQDISYISLQAGEPYDYGRIDRGAAGPVLIEAGYPSFRVQDRLRVSPEAADFFAEDGETGYSAAPRLRGIVLHGILSQVQVPSDLHRAVRKACLDGLLSSREGEEAEAILAERIASRPAWFDAGATVRNEAALIDTDGSVHRPDRVILRDGGVTVVDYKFGAEDPAYLRQVGKYAALYRRMGYERVEAYLWYVNENKIVSLQETL